MIVGAARKYAREVQRTMKRVAAMTPEQRARRDAKTSYAATSPLIDEPVFLGHEDEIVADVQGMIDDFMAIPPWRSMETPGEFERRRAAEASGGISYYANLHDSFCSGRVCLNPAHMPDAGEVIDVQPTTKERLRLTDGKDGNDQQ